MVFVHSPKSSYRLESHAPSPALPCLRHPQPQDVADRHDHHRRASVDYIARAQTTPSSLQMADPGHQRRHRCHRVWYAWRADVLLLSAGDQQGIRLASALRALCRLLYPVRVASPA